MAPDDIQDGNGNSPSPDLVSALERDQIQPHYLPKVDLRTGRVIGMEALARLKDPELGFIAAEEFLSRVEAGEQMRGLTKQMLESSTRAAGDWWRSGLGLQLSVNLSPDAFSSPEWRLHEIVARTLAEAGLPGEALQFEVTEDALAKEPDRMTNALRRLRALGVTVSIDDFGTGRFSIRQLLRLPIEELKIDRSLILGLDDDEDRTIVRSTIHLAHQMGLQVVAEGVETEQAWRQLRSMGCERAQGFLIAKPLPARAVPAWLAAWNHRARELSSTRRVQRRTKARAAKVTA
jgi:EAL domain-containing protein (putative c-di-GMP-specific phosphodiesterase class I)